MPGLLFGGLLGGLTALTLVALNYLAFQWAGLPRISFSLFDWLARVTPGGIITFMIDTMVMVITRLNLGPTSTVAKQVEQGLAILLFLMIGVVFGVALAAIGRRWAGRLPGYGLLGGLLLAVPFLLIQASLRFPSAGPAWSIFWIIVTSMVWGWVLAPLIQ